MTPPEGIRSVSRAIITVQEPILVARLKGDHSFLPSGAIEPGEAAPSALRRELREELGLEECAVGAFLGAVELVVPDDRGSLEHSLSILFEVSAEGLYPDQAPPSREPHLNFVWVRLEADALREANVQPELLHDALPRMLLDRHPLWLSNVDGWDRRG